jgi:hypothetical protein
MSIIFCEKCDSYKDTDYESHFLIGQNELCGDCFDELFCCEDCGGVNINAIVENNCIDVCKCLNNT